MSKRKIAGLAKVPNATVSRQQTEARQKELEDHFRPIAERYLQEQITAVIYAGESSFKVDVGRLDKWARDNVKKNRLPSVRFELRRRALDSALKELSEAGYQVRALDHSWDPTIEIKW